jgi:hypothetical protein
MKPMNEMFDVQCAMFDLPTAFAVTYRSKFFKMVERSNS